MINAPLVTPYRVDRVISCQIVVVTRNNNLDSSLSITSYGDVQKVCSYLVTSLIADIDLERRFQPATDIAGQTPVKSSVQRGIRSAILSSWKIDAETLEEIWPKKESIVHVRWSVASPPFPPLSPHAHATLEIETFCCVSHIHPSSSDFYSDLKPN